MQLLREVAEREQHGTRARPRPAGWRDDIAAGVVLALILTMPLLMIRIPFLVDYPNHLARMHVLATGAGTPALHAIFRVAWAFIPNISMDVVVPLLAQAMPLSVAGRIFIALAILLPPLGVVMLHRAWFGTRFWWPWIAVLTGAGAFLVFGFMNYLTGLGLALMAAAWHARLGTVPRPRDVLIAIVWGVVCLLAHMFAFGLLVLLMVSNEVGRRRSDRLLARALPIVGAAVVPVALYVAFGPRKSYATGSALGGALHDTLVWGLLAEPIKRIEWLLGPFTGQGLPLGIAAAALVVLPIAWAAWQGRLRVAAQMPFAFACLVLAYLLLPGQVLDTAMVFERLIVPVALVGIAGVLPRLPVRWGHALAGATVALIVVRSGAMAMLWHSQAKLLAEVEHVIAHIPPGARVVAVRDGHAPYTVDPDEPASHRILRRTQAYMHVPALVTLERDAFYPLIFSSPTKYPIALRPQYEKEAQDFGYLPLTSQLAAAADVPHPPGRCGVLADELPCMLWSWPTRYDYLLRLNAHDTPPPDAAHLREVARDGWAVLYRVQQAGGGGA
ncbi:MAG: hypothetical protein M0Z28_30250 [Rhodospirillales bacterium]|nr:hypothetical protein [Rhodospirillales bacterium]